jgi:hypothetical protein
VCQAALTAAASSVGVGFQLAADGGGELGQVAVALDAPEALLRLGHASRRPAPAHVAVADLDPYGIPGPDPMLSSFSLDKWPGQAFSTPRAAH